MWIVIAVLLSLAVAALDLGGDAYALKIDDLLIQANADKPWYCDGTNCCSFIGEDPSAYSTICFESSASGNYHSLVEVPLSGSTSLPEGIGSSRLPVGGSLSSTIEQPAHFTSGEDIDSVWKAIRGKLTTRTVVPAGCYDPGRDEWVDCDILHPIPVPRSATPVKGSAGDEAIGAAIDGITGIDDWIKTKLKDAAKESEDAFVQALLEVESWLGDNVKKQLDYIISLFEDEDLSEIIVGGKGACVNRVLSTSQALTESKLVQIKFQGQEVKVHKMVKPLFEKINEEITTANTGYNFWDDKAGGTYNWRCIDHKPFCTLKERSYHSFGVAIDINPDKNPYITTSPCTGCDIPKKVIGIFKDNDFEWGGDWSGKKDYMHFEWKGNKGDFDGDGTVEDCPKVPTLAVGELQWIYTTYKSQIDEAYDKHSVPKDVLVAIIKRESDGNRNAVSPGAAAGLMQFVPMTFIEQGGDVAFKGIAIDSDGIRESGDIAKEYQKIMVDQWSDCRGTWVSTCNFCDRSQCDYTNDERFNPDISIDLGAKYLKKLFDAQRGYDAQKWTAAFKRYHGSPDDDLNEAYAESVNKYRKEFEALAIA